MHRCAQVLAVSTLLLIFVGGLVTSTGSGLAVPDWPLSFGKFFPNMEGGVFFEHGHRMVASAIGLITLVLTLWLIFAENRRWVRWLGLVTLAAVVLQGILGGLTVRYQLPTALSVSHGCLAQIFLCLTITLAVVTSKWWKADRSALPASHRPDLRTISILTMGILFWQLLLGAWMRHAGAGLAIPTFPDVFGRWMPAQDAPGVQWIHYAHRVGAITVTLAIAWLVIRVHHNHPGQSKLVYLAQGVAGTLVMQIALGVMTITSWRAVMPTTLHVANGALLLGLTWLLTLRIHRLYWSAPAREQQAVAVPQLEPAAR